MTQSEKTNNERDSFLPKLPDLRRRGVKIRLMVLVFSVMLVLVLMFESRKPENWEWMGFAEREPNVDSRYLSHLSENQDGNSKAPPKIDLSATEESDREKMFALAEKDFLDKAYEKLKYRQRMILMEGLFLARHQRQLTDEQSSEWLHIVEAMETACDTYQTDILNYLTTLPETASERKGLSELLFRFKNRWEKFIPALKQIGNTGTPESPLDTDSLNSFQLILDRTAFGFIKDNSLQSVADDMPAMFRMFDMIQSSSQVAHNRFESADGSEKNNKLAADPTGKSSQSPQKQSSVNSDSKITRQESAPIAPVNPSSAEKVMYLQLYKETDRLRGKPVTFKGNIRTAYLSSPTENYLGIDDFYVFWVQIAGSQNLVAVYSLTRPENFVVPIRRRSDEQEEELNEPVEITGLLLQKMVYSAIDGVRIAPVILTDQIGWSSQDAQEGEQEEFPGLTTLVIALLSIGGAIALGTLFINAISQRIHGERIRKLKTKFNESDESMDESASGKDGKSNS